MQRVVSLVSLLFLGSAWTLQGVQALPETLSLTQENFDLGRFMGQWYEVAVVSTCPHYMQRKRGNPVIVALELQHVASQSNFTLTASTFRNGSCKRTSTNYNLTNTPGQFFYHVATGLVHLPPTGAHRSVMQHIANTFLPAGFGADVDSYVVHTNYEEYAMMLLLSTEKPSGNKTTIVKLYSRSVDVSPDVLDNFKTLVRQHGTSDGAIIMNQNKGECVPGDQATEPSTQTQISVPERSRRNVVPHVDSGNIGPFERSSHGQTEEEDHHTNTHETFMLSHA
ncbi:protein AMBP-like isoform X1 [Xiphias gladius]|uniref:protein AMBP-like isoform X1 n=1 Tax=Xiphias gladius TaxID=8245 RepID=UPI001A999371|nr:protein AMBP-like isoform X1 [Xiphias gladius]